MALIKCPNCGNSISDQSTNCIYCNYKIKVCPECGNTINEECDICPKCGFPIGSQSPNNKSSVSTQKSPVNNTKKIIIGALALCVLIGAVFGIKASLSNKENRDKSNSVNVVEESDSKNDKIKEDAKSHIEEESKLLQEKDLAEYKVNYSSAMVSMLEGAEISNDCCVKILKVWGNSIWEEHDDETDKYTYNGTEFYDFNTALDNLYSDPDFSASLESLYDNKDEVMRAIKKLNKYPDGMEYSYELIKEGYDSYKKLYNLATSPDGSFNSYSDEFSDATDNFMDVFDKIELETDMFDSSAN